MLKHNIKFTYIKFRPSLSKSVLGLLSGSVLMLSAVLSMTPSLAQESNFGELQITGGDRRATAQGYTGGSFSLSSIANNDRAGNRCIGFGDTRPDHILELKQGISQLTLQINSGGNDTTLLIQAPDGSLRCGDDTGRNKDASIQDKDWKPGPYKVWVGTFNPGTRWDYTLTVRQS